MNEQDTLTKMRVALLTSRVRQVDVAMHLGIAESELSRFLNGRRRLPEGFEQRFYQAVDELSPAGPTPVGTAA